MGYDGYQPYDPYESDPYRRTGGGGRPEQYPQQPPYEQQYEQQAEYEQPYEQQAEYQPEYEQQPEYGQYSGPQYEQQQPQSQYQYQDAQWAQSGLGWDRQAWDEARLGVSPLQEQGYARYREYEQYNEYGDTESEYAEYTEYGEYGQYEPRASQDPYAQPEAELPRELPVPDYPPAEQDELPRQRGAQAAEAEPSPAAVPNGRGAFGAAGIGVVAAVSALASSGALLVVIALIQAGIAYGWQQAVTLRGDRRPDRRAVVLTALIGWAASASAFRLPADDDFVGLPVTLGVGFLLLAADQTLRARPVGDGERVAGLDLAVTGGLFAVLPAGFVVAERSDTALTAACALAAAIGVLCCALLGRNPLRGIAAALVLGAGIGAVAAQSLSAHGGLKAGALGGAVAALGAAAALGALDRITAEGGLRGSSRIVAQVLPSALAAMGALFASAVFR